MVLYLFLSICALFDCVIVEMQVGFGLFLFRFLDCEVSPFLGFYLFSFSAVKMLNSF